MRRRKLTKIMMLNTRTIKGLCPKLIRDIQSLIVNELENLKLHYLTISVKILYMYYYIITHGRLEFNAQCLLASTLH